MPTNPCKTCTCNKLTQTVVIIQISDSPVLLLNKSSKENAKVDYQLKYFMGVNSFLCLL